ncbi:bifunctional metallophosphatase/5'-nucleotidase [Jeotgalibacillus haloalkalitolerans]|uniref:Bifunctional UDP-sugar hydrolase/5'-nucleotidase n=1 Tax=Jeotgalibacillus haloalkalitolerans TaxID=3104292 RepID=A0ABU5KQT1_9BACL|nr:bifunctional UDP-sugar hydrolase/5'-nucleotidase [Jeotgalibacillus sp. HH7-29]MDZ5713602.1 bifunctional UDP-sugar hydrolase/5'-nucleotidase [Jeotgalibacillus sp. HH7-29]
MKERITIFHTNDLHSHFENWPVIHQFLQQERAMLQAAGEEVYLFDIGDHADRSHPLTEGSAGKRNVDLLNEAGYDAVTIGNNEGITFSYEELNELYHHADFEVILANLFTSEGNRPDWACPYLIKTTKSGVKIGITAVTAEYPVFYEKLGWHITSAKDELKAQVRAMKDKVDIIVLLSHLGIREDEWVAEECPDIDIIMGGHTHHVLENGRLHNQVLLAAAGKYGMFTGKVEIEFDHVSRKVSGKTATLYETNELPAADDLNTIWLEEGRQLLSNEITVLKEPIHHNPLQAESPLSRLLAEAILDWCDADCAIVTGGLLLHPLEAGPVTEYDLHKILPHPINPCLVELTGSELKEVIRQSRHQNWPTTVIRGLGFRGTILGEFIYNGLEEKDHQFYVGGQEVRADQVYKIATVDMFTFGFFFPEMQRAKKQYFMPEFLRDILKDKLSHTAR